MLFNTHRNLLRFVIGYDWVVCLLCLLIGLIIIQPALSDTTDVEGGFIFDTTWDVNGSPYRILGDIEIPPDSTLIIRAGVEILFEGNFYFRIHGRITAIGGDSLHQRIRFVRRDSTQWPGISFQPGSHFLSTLRFCEIVNAWVAIDCIHSSPRLHNNWIYAENTGINCNASTPDISTNVIRVGRSNSSSDLTGIWLENNSNARIINNYIYVRALSGGEFAGISIDRSQPIVKDNWIEVKSNGIAYGVYVNHVTKLDMSHNIVRVRSPGRMDGIHLANAGGVYLYNNDFHLMASSAYATGIFVDVGSDIVVINNIVVGNGISVGIRSAEATVDTASGYNDFCYHLSNYEGYWEGSDNDITGDDADPMFVGNLAWDADTWEHYMLRWDNFPDDPVDNELKSPCIDTGHPDIIDPDSTRSDMGAVPFNQVPPNEQREINKDLEHPVDYSLLSAYPNPFNASISLNFTLPVSNSVQLNVFNLNGRLIDHIRTGVLQPGRHNFQWAPQELSSGVYLIRLETGSGNSLQKVIYLP